MKRRDALRMPLFALPAALSACDAARDIPGGFTGIAVERGHVLREARSWPAPSATHRVHTVIAGGGIAGLAAARALRRAGIDDFALLEMEDTAGGNSRGGSVGGIACPLGAHYLPVPGDDAPEVQDFLEELGLRKRVAGRWEYDERHLCHSPQERLFIDGAWQEGLLPAQNIGASTLAQYRGFAARVEALRRAEKFAIPVARSAFGPRQLTLDAVTFDTWLAQQGFDDTHLRWYLDYCCRDDYGAGSATVSAWAGIHYFASRHGFHAPGDADAEREPVLTWPEGNGFLAEALARPLGDRLHGARTVVRIAEGRGGVEVDAWHHAAQRIERWQARRCIVALPVFIAARVVQDAPDALRQAAARTRSAPWLVANLQLDAPLRDRPAGAAPAWDNVLYGTRGLGYVDARHQSLDPTPGPTVLTFYRALGDDPQGRAQLLQRPWTAWRNEALAELAVPHPDIGHRTQRVDITRYGHAMAIPIPGNLNQIGHTRTSSLCMTLSNQEQMAILSNRLLFAHADWSGYSIFEEAFTRGDAAGRTASS